MELPAVIDFYYNEVKVFLSPESRDRELDFFKGYIFVTTVFKYCIQTTLDIKIQPNIQRI